jgi:hypothetical protein
LSTLCGLGRGPTRIPLLRIHYRASGSRESLGRRAIRRPVALALMAGVTMLVIAVVAVVAVTSLSSSKPAARSYGPCGDPSLTLAQTGKCIGKLFAPEAKKILFGIPETMGRHPGFYNLRTLASDLQSKVQAKDDALRTGIVIASLGCVGSQQSETVAICDQMYVDQAGSTNELWTRVQVSKDGNTYDSGAGQPGPPPPGA